MKCAVTLLLLNAISAQYQGQSPKESFYKQSPSLNEWNDTGKIGAILGFAVFGIMYLYAIVMIFRDIRKNDKMYSELLEHDKKTMSELGMERNKAEIEEQLKIRLAGKTKETGADD